MSNQERFRNLRGNIPPVEKPVRVTPTQEPAAAPVSASAVAAPSPRKGIFYSAAISLVRWAGNLIGISTANRNYRERAFEKYTPGQEAEAVKKIKDSLRKQGYPEVEIKALLDRINWGLLFRRGLEARNEEATRASFADPLTDQGHGAKKGIFYYLTGRWVLPLIRGFWLRHPESDIYYHWGGKGLRSHLSQDEAIRIITDEIVRQSRSSRFTAWFADRAQDLRMLANKSILVGSTWRYLGERAELYLASSVFAGGLIAAIAANPLLLIPVFVLYVAIAVHYAPADKNLRVGHYLKMSLLPLGLVVLFAGAYFLGVPLLSVGVLGLFGSKAAAVSAIPILGTLLKTWSVGEMLSPLLTVMVRSYWSKTARSAKKFLTRP